MTLFEEQGMEYLENNLTASSAKKLFFFAALGYIMCDDAIGTMNKIEEFGYASPASKDCDEFKVILKVADTLEKRDTKTLLEI